MRTEIGIIEAIYRYPVKSMRGEMLARASLGWQGIEGDRRLAFRRLESRADFPWLTGSKFPDLVRFTPQRRTEESGDTLPSHIVTPEGEAFGIYDEALAADIGRRSGTPVQMLKLRHGIYDDATISVITAATADEICRAAETAPDVRRFRPNIVVRTAHTVPFEEDSWIGGVLTFGDGDDAPCVAVTMPDIRCTSISIDPDTGAVNPGVLNAAVRVNENKAGIYGTVTRSGQLSVGQTITLRR